MTTMNSSRTKKSRVPKERTVEQFIGLFLRRDRKMHKDGTPGAFSLRFCVIEHAGMKPQRVELGLRTNKRREAVQRALVVLNAMRSTARLWLANRELNLFTNTELPLWFPVTEMTDTARSNYRMKRTDSFPPPSKVARTRRAR